MHNAKVYPDMNRFTPEYRPCPGRRLYFERRDGRPGRRFFIGNELFAMKNIGWMPLTMLAISREGLLDFIPKNLAAEAAQGSDTALAGNGWERSLTYLVGFCAKLYFIHNKSVLTEIEPSEGCGFEST